MKPDHICDANNPVIRIGRGARAVENLLMRDLDALIQAARSEPRLLGHPVYIVVTSRSLRDHLAALLVQRYGRSLAGISIQTLFGLATQIVERAGERPSRGAALFEVCVRRYARQEDALREGLDELADGYGSVIGTVTDFLEAGFEPAHEEALVEKLTEVSSRTGDVAGARRARALVGVSRGVCGAMEQWHAETPSRLLQRATGYLRGDPSHALPTRAVLIHGFADAIGVALDFIESLMVICGAWVYLDHPPDPSIPEKPDMGVSFTQRLLSRLSPHAVIQEEASMGYDSPRVTLFNAPSCQAEVRELARRIRRLLESGLPPERIGVTGRDLAAYRIPLRIHFNRLGIPFSGLSTEGPSMGTRRRVQALLELLRRRSEASVDSWLDAKGFIGLAASTFQSVTPGDSGHDRVRHDLRLAFRSMGAARLKDLIGLGLEDILEGRDEYPLPVRHGLRGSEDEDEGDVAPMAPRRKIPGAVLRDAAATARTLGRRWERWDQHDDLKSHLEATRLCLVEDLGWTMRQPVELEIEEALQRLEDENPTDFPLNYEEFVLMLGRALSKIGAIPVGGRGGGIQVLNVMEARGRTFDQLFIVGLNRDVFPRGIREDPLLPDRIRRQLEDVLPDIPVKQRGFDEERFLFSQLLSSSPNVCLSWRSIDEDGKVIPVSPLVERMRLAADALPVYAAPDLYARPVPDGVEELRPAHEHATLVGLHGGRAQFERVFPAAITEAVNIHGLPKRNRIERIAGARVALLNELDPDLSTFEGRSRASTVGPYFGFVGPIHETADPRRGALYITTMEAMAACPWQTFIRRLLRIEPAPDPLQALPTLTALMRGATVHAVLERIVTDAGGRNACRLEDARISDPVAVHWPESSDLQGLSLREAERVLKESGMGLHGLTRALEAQASPYVASAGQVDWHDEDTAIYALGSELEGDLVIEDDAGVPRSIFFKADRADRNENLLILTDYKTGRPVSSAVTEKSRKDHLLREIKKGQWLQAVAYVLGAGEETTQGRYLFLRPDTPDHARIFTVNPGEQEYIQAFTEAVRALLSAWDHGVFFPRLLEPEGKREPRYCQYCEVMEACLRWDSGARARMAAWVKGLEQKNDKRARHEGAFIGCWRLGVSNAAENGK